ncbi:MAG TPA: hypothetical protein P5307_03930, partial [Pirellulaceae bacterium]|nr:hypothetical protein [Pirellulaceae bacterium]
MAREHSLVPQARQGIGIASSVPFPEMRLNPVEHHRANDTLARDATDCQLRHLLARTLHCVA